MKSLTLEQHSSAFRSVLNPPSSADSANNEAHDTLERPHPIQLQNLNHAADCPHKLTLPVPTDPSTLQSSHSISGVTQNILNDYYIVEDRIIQGPSDGISISHAPQHPCSVQRHGDILCLIPTFFPDDIAIFKAYPDRTVKIATHHIATCQGYIQMSPTGDIYIIRSSPSEDAILYDTDRNNPRSLRPLKSISYVHAIFSNPPRLLGCLDRENIHAQSKESRYFSGLVWMGHDGTIIQEYPQEHFLCVSQQGRYLVTSNKEHILFRDISKNTKDIIYKTEREYHTSRTSKWCAVSIFILANEDDCLMVANNGSVMHLKLSTLDSGNNIERQVAKDFQNLHEASQDREQILRNYVYKAILSPNELYFIFQTSFEELWFQPLYTDYPPHHLQKDSLKHMPKENNAIYFLHHGCLEIKHSSHTHTRVHFSQNPYMSSEKASQSDPNPSPSNGMAQSILRYLKILTK